jgi:four helix bundle protein
MYGRGTSDLRLRTKRYAVGIVTLFTSLPKTDEARTLGRQMLRSGTSVGAQYREACRARSNAEFISKVESLLQELDETTFWLELLVETRCASALAVIPLVDESDELTKIFVTMVRRTKRA